VFAVLWQLPVGKSEAFYFWYFLGGSILFYLGYTVFATPWVALGYELTPDYHERTRLMGVQNIVGTIAYVIAPYFLLIMQNEILFKPSDSALGFGIDLVEKDMVQGAADLAIIIGVIVVILGVMPAIFLRERFKAIAIAEALEKGTEVASATSKMMRNMKEFFVGFGKALKFKPFLKLCAATFLVFNGFIMIAAFQSYVIIYYVFGGDTNAGSEYVGHAGSLGAVSSFVVIFMVTWLGPKFGKRRAFYVTTGLSMLGYLLKWFCYNPDLPWLVLLPAPLMAFGLGGLFTLMPAMVADVVDADELQTHERREGMYGSIFWWVVKLGMAAALAAGGFLLNATGFDVALGGEQAERTIFLMRIFDIFVPFVASGIAIWAITTYSITEEKAYEVRKQLEARRGT
jgi:GPH family glycoside/pentoside/hexuronide:cation symporter